MVEVTTEAARTAARSAIAFVGEAARRMAGGSRQTAEAMDLDSDRLTEIRWPAAEAGATALESTVEASRTALRAVGVGSEATLRAAFEVQNAVLDTGAWLVGTAANSSRGAFQDWADATRRAQLSTLAAWQTSLRATEHLLLGIAPEGTRQR
jgi:hypothetical protein